MPKTDPSSVTEGSCTGVLPAKGGVLPFRTSTTAIIPEGSPTSTPEDSVRASALRRALDPVLLAAVALYLVAQTAHVWLVKAQDGVTAASCDGCPNGESFNSPMLQAFFGDVGELLTLPAFLIAEHLYLRRYGILHGSAAVWSSIERWLGGGPVSVARDAPPGESKQAEPCGACAHCDVWRQRAVVGFVLRAGRLSPATCGDRSIPPRLLRDPPKPRVPFYFWSAPAALGLAYAVFKNMALEVMDMATQSMLDGLVIPLVAGLSWMVLRKRLLAVPHLLGVALVLAGVLTIGALPALIPPVDTVPQASVDIDSPQQTVTLNHSELSPDWRLGLALTGLSVLCLALNTITHEYFLTYHDCNPLEVIALDSAWTVGLSLGMLPLAANLGLENIRGGLYQIAHSPTLTAMVAAYSLVHIPAQAMVYVIISRSGALTMAMVQQCQTGVLWVMDVSFAGALFVPIQLAAYAVIAAGTLVYTYVLPVRAWLQLEPPLHTVIQEEEEDVRRTLLSRYLRGYGGSWLSQFRGSDRKEKGSAC